MSIPDFALNTNTVMAIVLSLVLLYGLLLGQNKLKTFALSAFVGLVMVLTFADSTLSLLQKTHWDMGGRIGLTTVKLALFSLPVIILEFGHKEKGKNRGGISLTLVLATLTAALLISSVLSFLGPEAVAHALQESTIANWIYTFRLAWLVAVPLAVVGGNLIQSKSH